MHFAAAQIRVSPVAFYLDDHDRNGRLYIENGGNQDKDVVIDIRFGYPVSDDSGRVSFRFMDSLSPDEPSAAGWISVFPQSFTLPAGTSQTVAVMSTPPSGLADGEYWARPVLTFRSSSNISQTAGDIENETQLVLSVNYRHGSVFTGISPEGISLERSKQKVSAVVQMTRTGNAAFLGNLVCRLIAGGVTVGQETSEVAVYHSLKKRIDFSVPDAGTGDFVVEAELNSKREGNKPGDILQTVTAVGREEFVLVGTR